jgi:thiol-disulfide isomerase/thioredoxin
MLHSRSREFSPDITKSSQSKTQAITATTFVLLHPKIAILFTIKFPLLIQPIQLNPTMPIQVTSDPPFSVATTLKANATPTHASFLVVYASLLDGKSWCPDCRQAEPVFNKVFESKPDAVRIVYAGQRAEWKDPANPWRQAPFSVKGVPTLIKVTADGVSFPFQLSFFHVPLREEGVD